jgi:hypothetical protein
VPCTLNLSAPLARRLPPGGSSSERTGGSPRLRFAPKVRANERTGGSPRLCFAPKVRANERAGGSPRLRFAPKVRAGEDVAIALSGPLARGLPPGG